MFPNSGYNFGFLHFLVKIFQMLEVCDILLFICCLGESNGNMFPSYPFIEIVFNLDSEFISGKEENKHNDLQLLRQGRWLSTRAFHPQRTLGASHCHLFPLGTNSCWWVIGWLEQEKFLFSALSSTRVRPRISRIFTFKSDWTKHAL